ncbi:MAG: Stp1/IreP family PP2C-type Ser/Thr phosphatase [Clostridia bacterium]|nr:Stp1/IreP family PP2C-type Ser/Thr phosphatase [Clostridia bacterium]
MRIFAKTDVGKVRSLNEDSFVARVLPDGAALTVVCDGMGGANAGDFASKTAVEIISRYVINSYDESMTSDDMTKLLRDAITSANLEVFEYSKKAKELFGMGTTVVATIARDNCAVVCSAGDSRAYLVNDTITQITRDHSVVQSLIESGKITREEARTHPEKNIITRALGVEEYLIVDDYYVEINPCDKILLCTDGLTNYVVEDSILNTIKNKPLDMVTDSLIQQANDGGGRDNITVAVVSH